MRFILAVFLVLFSVNGSASSIVVEVSSSDSSEDTEERQARFIEELLSDPSEDSEKKQPERKSSYWGDIHKLFGVEKTRGSVSYTSNAPLNGKECETKTLVCQPGILRMPCVESTKFYFEEISTSDAELIRLKGKDAWAFSELGQSSLCVHQLENQIVFTVYNSMNKKGFMCVFDPLSKELLGNQDFLLYTFDKKFSGHMRIIKDAVQDERLQRRRVRHNITVNCVSLWPSDVLDDLLRFVQKHTPDINLYCPNTWMEVIKPGMKHSPSEERLADLDRKNTDVQRGPPSNFGKTAPPERRRLFKKKRDSVKERRKSGVLPPTISFPSTQGLGGMKPSKSSGALDDMEHLSLKVQKLSESDAPFPRKGKKGSRFLRRNAKSANSSPLTSGNNSPEDSSASTTPEGGSLNNSPQISPRINRGSPGHIQVLRTVDIRDIPFETFLCLMGQKQLKILFTPEGKLKVDSF